MSVPGPSEQVDWVSTFDKSCSEQYSTFSTTSMPDTNPLMYEGTSVMFPRSIEWPPKEQINSK